MSIQTIHDKLKASGMTEEGVLGLMANMRAESGMRANNVQDGCGWRDEDYTAQVDNGLHDFADGIGYGLCQWTESKGRKPKLLAFAKMQGTSIGDEDMQVRFAIWELMNDFPQVWAVLTSSDDLRRCTEIVLNIYENPKVKNLEERYQCAREFAALFRDGGKVEQAPEPQPESEPEPWPWGMDLAVMQLQTIMRHDGYWDGEIDGRKTDEFRAAIVKYAEAVASC